MRIIFHRCMGGSEVYDVFVFIEGAVLLMLRMVSILLLVLM